MSTPVETIERIRAQREVNRQRRADIVRVISDLQQEQLELESADREMQIAERVVSGLLPPGPAQSLGDVLESVVSSLEPEPKPSRKPPGLPPILEMANEAFAHFEAQGTTWATCPMITEFIRSKWWPTAKAEYISPQLWRAYDRGDLLKHGPRFARKSAENEKGPATEVARPSQSNGAIGSNPIGT